jgi:hypothetical protein
MWRLVSSSVALRADDFRRLIFARLFFAGRGAGGAGGFRARPLIVCSSFPPAATSVAEKS